MHINVPSSKNNVVFSYWVIQHPMHLLSLLLFALLAVSGFSGCSRSGDEDVVGDKESQEERTDRQAEVESSDAVRHGAETSLDAWQVQLAPDGSYPELLRVLPYFPADAHLGIAVSSAETMIDNRLMPLLHRYAHGDWNPDELNVAWANPIAESVGAQSGQDLITLFKSMGFKTDAPLAVFFWHDIAFKYELESPTEPSVEAHLIPVDVNTTTQWVAVLPIAEQDRVLHNLNAMFNDAAQDDNQWEQQVIEGITLHTHSTGLFSHTFHEDNMLIGTHTGHIVSAIQYAENPLPPFYGTSAMPASVEDDAVVFLNMQQYVKDQQHFVEQLPDTYPMLPALKEQHALLAGMLDGPDTFSPAVINMQWDTDALKMIGRINLERYPGVLEMAGTPTLHRWMSRLPTNTDSCLSLAFSEAMKGNLLNILLPMFSPHQNTNEMLNPVSLTMQVSPLLGDEIMLGLATDVADDMPQVYLAIGLGNPDGARLLLQLFLPMIVTEDYRDVEIYTLELETPTPFYIVFSDQSVVGTNHLPGLKEMIGHVLDETSASPDSPIHRLLAQQEPRFTSLVLNTDTLVTLLGGLHEAGVSGANMLNPVTEFLIRAVSELHLYNTQDANFQQLEFIVSFR